MADSKAKEEASSSAVPNTHNSAQSPATTQQPEVSSSKSVSTPSHRSGGALELSITCLCCRDSIQPIVVSFMLQSTASSPSKAPPLKSPWAAIVRSEPKQKESANTKPAGKAALQKSASNGSAVSNQQDSQTTLPSYAPPGTSQRQSTPDSKKPPQTISTDRQSPSSQPGEVDKHAPSTPVASTSPVPPSDSSSSTADKSREDNAPTDPSTSRATEAEVLL